MTGRFSFCSNSNTTFSCAGLGPWSIEALTSGHPRSDGLLSIWKLAKAHNRSLAHSYGLLTGANKSRFQYRTAGCLFGKKNNNHGEYLSRLVLFGSSTYPISCAYVTWFCRAMYPRRSNGECKILYKLQSQFLATEATNCKWFISEDY